VVNERVKGKEGKNRKTKNFLLFAKAEKLSKKQQLSRSHFFSSTSFVEIATLQNISFLASDRSNIPLSRHASLPLFPR